MPLPEYLADLPSLNKSISRIEESIKGDPHQRYGDWRGQPTFPDENTDAWTQKHWMRYDDFIRAGRACPVGNEKYLPTPQRCDKELPSSAADDVPPFSPLAMMAALDICGYKQKPVTPADIRQLSQALALAATTDLDEIFALSPLLDHILDYSIHHQDDEEFAATRRFGGAKAAEALKDVILSRMHALATWPWVVELLDQVDWTDEALLMALASDPAYAEESSADPLCKLLQQVDYHEIASAVQLRMLFKEWALKHIPPTEGRPKWWTDAPASVRAPIPDRLLHAKSLIGMNRFQRALFRVCRPTLHAMIPPQISLLDLEMLVRENPKRGSDLSAALQKAIGYHYTVVRVHYMLRKLISDKASACAGWQTRSVDKMSGKPRISAPAAMVARERHKDITYTRLQALNLGSSSPARTFRDHRFFRLSFHLGPINWANYLQIDLDTTPRSMRYDGSSLRKTLNAACLVSFGFPLGQLLQSRSVNPVPRSSPYRFELYPEQERDILLAASAMTNEQSTYTIGEMVVCQFQPAERQHPPRTISSSERTIFPMHQGSAPLAQSGHSYLRDNPAIERPLERVAAPDTPAPMTVEEEGGEEAPRFLVNSAQMKLVERLLGKREGVLRWSQLVNADRFQGRRHGRISIPYHSGRTRRTVDPAIQTASRSVIRSRPDSSGRSADHFNLRLVCR